MAGRTQHSAPALDSHKRRNARKPTLPSLTIKLEQHGEISRADIAVDHPDDGGYQIIADAMASGDGHFVAGMIRDIIGLGWKGKSGQREPDIACANFALSIIKEIEPKDPLETLLASQMAAIHMATMSTAALYANGQTMQHKDMAERSLNRLARTFAAQIEALKRHRSKGEQRVIVERVYVADGGQAVVGMVGRQPEGVGRGGAKLDG